MGNKYDIFISYRRATGKNYARTIKPELEKRGFHVFLDFDELKDGVFDKRIMDAISDAPVFLMILSKGALDRCINEGDWVRLEILYANEQKKHIVPVEVDKNFRDIPEYIPKDVKVILGAHQFAQIDTESLLQVSMDKLVRERIMPHVPRSVVGNTIVPVKNELSIEVHVTIDADCDCYIFSKHVAKMTVAQDNIIYLKSGKYKLRFVLERYPDIKVDLTYTASHDIYSDIIEVSFENMIAQKEKELEKIKEKEEKKKNREEKINLKVKRNQARRQWLLTQKKNTISSFRKLLKSFKTAWEKFKSLIITFYTNKKERNAILLCSFTMLFLSLMGVCVTFYIEKKEKESREEWIKRHPTAPDEQYELGMAYLNGINGVIQNIDSALSYLKKSANQNYSLAFYTLGELYMTGEYGISPKDTLAARYFQKAASMEVIPAYAKYGDMCKEGKGVSKDIWTAYKNYKVGAEKGDTAALWRVTKCYLDKNAIVCFNDEKEWKIAKEYYENKRNSNKINVDKTQFGYQGEMYSYRDKYAEVDILIKKGLGFSDVFYKNQLDAIIYSNLMALAIQGHPSAIKEMIPRVKTKKEKIKWIMVADTLGIIVSSDISSNAWKAYADSLFSIKDYGAALKSYQSVLKVDSSDKYALQKIAWFYLNGKRVNKDEQKAFQIYRQTKNELALSFCYLKGSGVTKNLDSARCQYMLYNQALYGRYFNSTDYDTLLIMGDSYNNGNPIEIDTLKARKEYELCATKGNRVAQYKLGHYYKKHNNMSIAKAQFEKSAKKNFAPAQYQLGEYYQSKGMYRTAASWYEKAANNKYKLAAYKLSYLYSYDHNGINAKESTQSNKGKDKYWWALYMQLP